MNDYTLLIVGGLVLLVIVVLIVLIARRKPAAPAKSSGPSETVTPTPVTTPATPSVATLEFPIENGPSVVFTLTRPLITLGRAEDNDIVLPASVANSDTVSTHHAQLRRDQDDFVVRDLDSRNGLTVNGRHTLHNLLRDGDQLGFGAAEAIFHNPIGGQHEVR